MSFSSAPHLPLSSKLLAERNSVSAKPCANVAVEKCKEQQQNNVSNHSFFLHSYNIAYPLLSPFSMKNHVRMTKRRFGVMNFTPLIITVERLRKMRLRFSRLFIALPQASYCRQRLTKPFLLDATLPSGQ